MLPIPHSISPTEYTRFTGYLYSYQSMSNGWQECFNPPILPSQNRLNDFYFREGDFVKDEDVFRQIVSGKKS